MIYQNRIYLLLPVFLVCVCSLSAGAQAIDSLIHFYGTRFPQEKIHVHFDKSYYNAGETIWFKAYLMSGTALSEISRNMYFELSDDAGKVVERKTAPILGSSAAASFDIPSTYTKQRLYFRAYTTWMLNFDSAFLYEKPISIVSAAKTVAAASNPASLRFFPEGGDLVAGTESVLAFKATDQYGKPVKAKGTVFTKAGKKVVDFAAVHNGMGTLVLTPLKGETYMAKWKDPAGKEQTTVLPEAQENGVVLHLTPNEGATQFILRKSAADSGQVKKLLVIAHMNQEIVYEAKVNFSASSATVNGSIPTGHLPSGVMQVTLFNEAQRPLQERIVFVNNNDYIFDAWVSTGEKKLAKRGRNVLQVEVPDTLQTNLSISVTDAAVNVPDENEDNIYSHFLLSSELRGYIHNPGYYFSSYADSVRRQLDLVMLTNGWRRFKWEELAQGKFPEIKYIPEDYLSIKGTISGVSTAKLAGTQLNMFLELKDSTRKFLAAPVTKDGTFNLPGVLFYDTARISYQFNNDKTLADRVAIRVDNGLLKTWPVIAPSKTWSAYLQDSIIAINKKIAAKYTVLEEERDRKIKMLEGVTVKARSGVKTPIQQLDEQYTSGLFSGGISTYSLDPSSDLAAQGVQNSGGTVFSYMQGRIPGLQISNAMSSNPSITIRGSKTTLYLNEMPAEPQMIAAIPMNEIAYIKVINDGGVGKGGGGGIAIYTKKAGAQQPVANDPTKGLSKMMLTGYSPIKEFYSPDYSSPDTPADAEDIRVTLYWNPYLVMDRSLRRATVSFYNNDVTKKFRVIIEGVNAAGKLTRIEEIIQ